MRKVELSWTWREGRVRRSSDHFELRYGSSNKAGREQWVPVALLGRPQKRVFKVQFLIDRSDSSHSKAIKALIDELNFYLVEQNERDPWAYAKYHCGTMANMYSSIHWSFFPKSRRRVTVYNGKVNVKRGQQIEHEPGRKLIFLAQSGSGMTPDKIADLAIGALKDAGAFEAKRPQPKRPNHPR